MKLCKRHICTEEKGDKCDGNRACQSATEEKDKIESDGCCMACFADRTKPEVSQETMDTSLDTASELHDHDMNLAEEQHSSKLHGVVDSPQASDSMVGASVAVFLGSASS